MCFPTVANAVTAAVPAQDVGVAAGTNNALNALGGVFGVAIMAAVFAGNGGYPAARDSSADSGPPNGWPPGSRPRAWSRRHWPRRNGS